MKDEYSYDVIIRLATFLRQVSLLKAVFSAKFGCRKFKVNGQILLQIDVLVFQPSISIANGHPGILPR